MFTFYLIYTFLSNSHDKYIYLCKIVTNLKVENETIFEIVTPPMSKLLYVTKIC